MQARWQVLAQWVVANAAGWLAGMVLGVAATLAAGRLGVNADRFLAYGVLLAVAVCVSLSQERVLARYVAGRLRWVLSTMAGYLLVLALLTMINEAGLAIAEPLFSLLLLLPLGIAVGSAQWLALRRHVQRAGVWPAASALSFLPFLWLVANPASSLIEFAVRATLLAALGSLATGLALVWLLRPQRA